MRKSPLIGTALIVLLGSVGTAAAQRGTSYDWNELSPPQAEFMAQQRTGRNNANQSVSTNEMSPTRQAVAGGVSTPSKPAQAAAPSAGDPTSEVSLSSAQKGVIFRGAIAQAQSAPSDFHPSMGATVPRSLGFYAFDDRVQSLIPAAKKYDYIKLPSNDILLVDPNSRKVVAMIEQKNTTDSK
jgi:hypothetical protein